MADEINAVAVKDQLWKGRVLKIGADSGGNAEMLFEIYDANTSEVLYPNLTVNGSPDDIINRAQAMAAELRLKMEQTEAIQVGQEFEI